MVRVGRIGFLGIAIVFTWFIFNYSIFDNYFVSPIVHGMRAYKVDTPEPPARRLVLYVSDGLRADKAFQFFPDPSKPINDSSVKDVVPMAPFLRSRVLNHGTFGVSHTRVPTESRAGHVALIAGLYEDVAAVTTGWKLNPKPVYLELGESDILPIFSAGAVPGRVEDQMYEAEFEDYSKHATELDYWGFDSVKKLFKDADTDKKLNAKLRQDIIVFFLPLLGLDTTGHAHRPYSQEYLKNIQIVDQGVQEITEIIDSLLVFQASLITYYAYVLFLVLLWEDVLARTMVLAEVKFAMNAALCLVLLEVMTIPSKDGQGTADSNGVSKLITGLQVQRVLKAKQGLPLGTQIAGWATLVSANFGFLTKRPEAQRRESVHGCHGYG
ncbi:hypothetical protein TEQG_08689 [Trichophyton equinum CBS 127.97]|uniref:GPI ethanolamine phosphate transferase 1 n=1 Tax=Trichophyton equinum (strain ATCC MYA-4606 / CBS 127.97) TaxID=559882 RepID=F2PU38_TRIEC|nr:hypothetical protein TEQG_08689 [Trichophyton equinum CBS 127.97]